MTRSISGQEKVNLEELRDIVRTEVYKAIRNSPREHAYATVIAACGALGDILGLFFPEPADTILKAGVAQVEIVVAKLAMFTEEQRAEVRHAIFQAADEANPKLPRRAPLLLPAHLRH